MGVPTSPASREVVGLKAARREGLEQRANAAQTSAEARQPRCVVPRLCITHLRVFVFLYRNITVFVYVDNTTVFVFVYASHISILSVFVLDPFDLMCSTQFRLSFALLFNLG